MQIKHKTGIALSTALAGALALGTAGTVVAATHDSPAPDTAQAAGADKLAAPLKGLGAVGKVSDTLTAALAKKPDAAKVVGLAKQAGSALDAVAAKRPAQQHGQAPGHRPQHTTEQRPQQVPAQQPQQAPHGAPAGAQDRAGAGNAEQLTRKAAGTTRKSLDAVVSAVRAKDPAKTRAAVKSSAQSTVNLATSLVLGGKLPAPKMAGLPKLPALGSGQGPLG